MTMLALYASKKALKESIGTPLKYRETSMFGTEYLSDGSFVVAGRPQLYSGTKREFFAKVTMANGLIAKVS
jgi:hypothetical protein